MTSISSNVMLIRYERLLFAIAFMINRAYNQTLKNLFNRQFEMNLNKHARYRQEDDYISLCSVDTLQYPGIENKRLNPLNDLEEGEKIDFDTKKIQSEEVTLFLEDLSNGGFRV